LAIYHSTTVIYPIKSYLKNMNWKISCSVAGLILIANLAACSSPPTSNQTTPNSTSTETSSPTGDAMSNDEMKNESGDAMSNDAMSGDAMPDPSPATP
jgi:hypothetical protein